MSRRASDRQWKCRRIPFGYVENRNGIACLRYKGKRRTARVNQSSAPLPFISENREQCLQMLEQWVLRLEHPDLFPLEHNQEPGANAGEDASAARTVHTLIREFVDVRFPDLTKVVQDRFRVAVTKYFPTDMPLEYEVVYEHLRKQRRSIQSAPETRRKDLQYVQRLLSFAVDRDYLRKNPMKVIGVPKQKQNDDNAAIYSPEEVVRIVSYFKRRAEEPATKRLEQHNFHQYALLFQFLSLTALRSNEALKLTWADISEQGFWIMGKGRRKRYFPLVNPETGERLLPEVDDVLAELRRATAIHRGKVFLWKNTQSPGKALQQAKLAMGWMLDGRAVKTFRATAEWYWDNVLGIDFLLGCQLAGHSPAVRVKNYVRRRKPEELARALARNLQYRTLLAAQAQAPQSNEQYPGTNLGQ